MSDLPIAVLANAWIDTWRRDLWDLTLAEAIVLLRHLGDFELDRIIVLAGGYHHFPAHQLPHHFDPYEYCTNIRPLYFQGGPFGGRKFKGTFLTMVLDRVLLVAHEKGAEHVDKLVSYARGFGTTSKR